MRVASHSPAKKLRRLQLYSSGAEARVANQALGTDPVFDQFLKLCEAAGPTRCALAGGSQTAAERVSGLFARLIHPEAT